MKWSWRGSSLSLYLLWKIASYLPRSIHNNSSDLTVNYLPRIQPVSFVNDRALIWSKVGGGIQLKIWIPSFSYGECTIPWLNSSFRYLGLCGETLVKWLLNQLSVPFGLLHTPLHAEPGFTSWKGGIWFVALRWPCEWEPKGRLVERVTPQPLHFCV